MVHDKRFIIFGDLEALGVNVVRVDFKEMPVTFSAEVVNDLFIYFIVISFCSYVLKVPFEGSGSGIVYIWIGR